MQSFRERHPELFTISKKEKIDAEHDINNNIKTADEGNCEVYRPSTMDEAWKLAESFLANQRDSNKKTNLILVAKKYKNTPNVDIVKFFTKNDKLFIEKIPSDGLDFNDGVFISYYVKDCKSGNAYFPQTTKEAWQLVDDLMPKKLVEEAKKLRDQSLF